MAKKTIISSILMTNVPSFAAAYFRVGCSPKNSAGQVCANPENEPAFPLVEKIEHCRDRFGGGAQVDQPCYVVHFEDAEEKVIIPVTEFCQATVVVIEDGPVIPAMPQ